MEKKEKTKKENKKEEKKEKMSKTGKITVAIVIVLVLVTFLIIPVRTEAEKIWYHYGEIVEAGGYRYKATKYNIYGMKIYESEISEKEYYELNN